MQFVSINSEIDIKLNQALQKITKWKENFKVTIVFLKCKIFTFGTNCSMKIWYKPFGSMKINCHELEHQKKKLDGKLDYKAAKSSTK